MSILSYHDIYNEMMEGNIVIEPYDRHCLGTNSYDVHLAPTLLTYDRPKDRWNRVLPIDCKVERATTEIVIPEEGYVLHPGQLYLASTIEYTETRRHIPFLEGKSSLGRLGLSIHVTAGKGDVGFCGHWTMEMHVIGDALKIYAGMPIGQLIYHEVRTQPVVDYAKKATQKYAAQGTISTDPKPVASRMWKNFPDGQPLKSEE